MKRITSASKELRFEETKIDDKLNAEVIESENDTRGGEEEDNLHETNSPTHKVGKSSKPKKQAKARKKNVPKKTVLKKN